MARRFLPSPASFSINTAIRVFPFFCDFAVSMLSVGWSLLLPTVSHD